MSPTVSRQDALLTLSALAAQAGSERELAFLLVNDSVSLLPYRQSVLWGTDLSVDTLSGVLNVDAQAPYVLWLEQLGRALAGGTGSIRRLAAEDLGPGLAAEWAQWWPAHALWLTGGEPGQAPSLLLARDTPFSDEELALASAWWSIWCTAWRAARGQPRSWRDWWRVRPRRQQSSSGTRPWYRRWGWALAAGLVALLPVRLSTLVPAELVPARSTSLRAPLDGVIASVAVQPNQQVSEGQLLLSYDDALLQSRLEVARQGLQQAEIEYRQATQQALSDARVKSQLAQLTGKIGEKRAELAYLETSMGRSRLLAPHAGLVLIDDPSEWSGRTVAVGDPILRLAEPGAIEVEAWVPLADALPLPEGAPVRLYLNASPLEPVEARLRYMAFEAQPRPDGVYAYRVRASLASPTSHRLGLKGMAKLSGPWVPLAYWALRRPWAALRVTLGI